MMGNFSFGDYFKKEAILFAWEYLTRHLGLDPDVLWITVYTEDDEAEGLWKNVAGVRSDRIVRLGEKDNFWQMGNTGPCGPCSEILVDQGPEFSCGRPTCAVGCDCDRYLEIWNLVFMQYDRNESGLLAPLPRPSIDTGMGLERLSSVLQGVSSNFETDLFLPLITALERTASVPYGRGSGEKDFAYRVIADHIRASYFLVWEGLVPSNEGRGYVLRRFIRRAVQFGRDLGLGHPFLPSLGETFVQLMQASYPDLGTGSSRVRTVLEEEELRFIKTLDYGLPLVREIQEDLRKKGSTTVSGESIFWLYDTHGIPVDVIDDWVRPYGFSLDMEGFSARMDNQKERGRRSWVGQKSSFSVPASRLVQGGEFVGYDRLNTPGRVLLLVLDGQEVKEVSRGAIVELVVDVTPFYPEGGGQAGDRGTISGPSGIIEVSGAYRPYPGWVAHTGIVRSGTLSLNDPVELSVDPAWRKGARIHHTSTHLLHAALRQVLGDHVRQAGSLVLPDRLRFDFTHNAPVSQGDLTEIESLVNRWIGEGEGVHVEEMAREAALSHGALAFFGEKYGERVRVVEIPGMSVELCGGTHAGSTAEIGSFYIVQESGIAAGTRRIEAVAGAAAYAHSVAWREELSDIRRLLKLPGGVIAARLESEREDKEKLAQEVRTLKSRLFEQETAGLLQESFYVGDLRILVAGVECEDGKDLRLRIDALKTLVGSGVVILAGRASGKAILLGWASQDLEKAFPVNIWIRKMAEELGGKGGGRPLWAEGGGTPPPSWNEFLDRYRSEIQIAAGLALSSRG
jgi:alanyl-tRNA synthetase